MTPEIWAALIAGAISLVVSTVVSAWTQRKKLVSDYDVALRTERLVEYRKLWQITEPLGWYGKHEITAEKAQQLLADLDRWYFENGGGILLSDVSMKSFEAVLKTLYDYQGNPEPLRQLGTKLRATLASDVLGRNLPMLQGNVREEMLAKKAIVDQRPDHRI